MKHILNSTGHRLDYPNIVRAENCTLYDSNGNSYLDLESGVWCTGIGHCNPRISGVIHEQAAKMIHSGYCYLNPLIDECAGKILEICGLQNGKCVFLNSGSEAVEYSVKLIRCITDKPYFLTMKNCYLSAYGISGELSDDQWIHYDWMTENDIKNIDFSQIAAFVFEPGSSQGLVRFPPKETITGIVSKIREHGAFVIINEITTGIGRTGRWFGYNHYDLEPDIIAIGKGLGNGYPVSCSAISESVCGKIDFNGFHYAQSHQNDPLGAAVAYEVIKIIEEKNLLERAKETGEYIRRRLQQIKTNYGKIREVRGRGLMIAIEFEHIERFSLAERVNCELLKKHIILVKRPGHEVLRMDPALTIEMEQVDYFLNTLETIISEIPVA